MAKIFCLRSYRFAKQCGMTLQESLGYAYVYFDQEDRRNAFLPTTHSKTSKKTNDRVRSSPTLYMRRPR